jgi:hypothetical protein
MKRRIAISLVLMVVAAAAGCASAQPLFTLEMKIEPWDSETKELIEGERANIFYELNHHGKHICYFIVRDDYLECEEVDSGEKSVARNCFRGVPADPQMIGPEDSEVIIRQIEIPHSKPFKLTGNVTLRYSADSSSFRRNVDRIRGGPESTPEPMHYIKLKADLIVYPTKRKTTTVP